MEGPLYCFNCGQPTDLVTDAWGAICRDCLGARKGEVAPAVEGQDYAEHTVAELRDLLRDRDLTVSGTREELITRLVEDDAEGEG